MKFRIYKLTKARRFKIRDFCQRMTQYGEGIKRNWHKGFRK